MGEQEIKWEGSQIDWQVGQEVFCLLRSKGVVSKITKESTTYPVEVDFEHTYDQYTLDGKIYDDHKNRVLFFSEPKIEAEKFPPKKTFVATLKKGDLVVVKHKRLEDKAILTVEQEDEDVVWFKEREEGYLKPAWNFFKVGEEVEFE